MISQNPTNNKHTLGKHEPILNSDLGKNVLVYPLLINDNPDIQRGGCLVNGIEHQFSKQNRGRAMQAYTSVDIKEWRIKQRKTPIKLNGFWLYAGPIYKHFGHCMAESFHRLWPAIINRKLPLKGLLFLGKEGEKNEKSQYILNYQREVIEYFNLNSMEIKICTEPLIVEKLLIPTQASTLGPLSEPSDQYINLLTENMSLVNSKYESDCFYISRSKLQSTSRLIGEKLIETKLRKHGFKIIYPEDLNLIEQLEIYSSAKRLVFCEGSAIHALEILGTIKADVDIVSRGGFRQKRLKSMESILSKRCANLFIHDQITRHPPLTFMKDALGQIVPCHWNIGIWFKFHEFKKLIIFLTRENEVELDFEEYKKHMSIEFLDYLLDFGSSNYDRLDEKSFNYAWIETKRLINSTLDSGINQEKK